MQDNRYQNHAHHATQEDCAEPKQDNCEVQAIQQVPFADENTPVNTQTPAVIRRLKVPVVLVEKTIQSVVEANIPLNPPATEIKRVKKHVFFEHKITTSEIRTYCNTNIFTATRAKLFIAGHIRKNIEYASEKCNGDLQIELQKFRFLVLRIKRSRFSCPPISGISESAEANFLNEKTELGACLDKNFFQNLVNYNEQPYGELVAANFFELDFSPSGVNDKGISTLCAKKSC